VTAWQAVQLARAERDQAVKQGQAERDQARRSRDVQDVLAKAAALREQARKAADDEGQWAEARAEARKAEGLGTVSQFLFQEPKDHGDLEHGQEVDRQLLEAGG